MSHNSDEFQSVQRNASGLKNYFLYTDGWMYQESMRREAERLARDYDHKVGDVPAEYETPRSGLPVPSLREMELVPGYRPRN